MLWQATILANGGSLMDFVAAALAITVGVIAAKSLQAAFGL